MKPSDFKVGNRVIWLKDDLRGTPGMLGTVRIIEDEGIRVDWDNCPPSWGANPVRHVAGKSLEYIALYAAAPPEKLKFESPSPRVACLTPGACPKCAAPLPCTYHS